MTGLSYHGQLDRTEELLIYLEKDLHDQRKASMDITLMVEDGKLTIDAANFPAFAKQFTTGLRKTIDTELEDVQQECSDAYDFILRVKKVTIVDRNFQTEMNIAPIHRQNVAQRMSAPDFQRLGYRHLFSLIYEVLLNSLQDIRQFTIQILVDQQVDLERQQSLTAKMVSILEQQLPLTCEVEINASLPFNFCKVPPLIKKVDFLYIRRRIKQYVLETSPMTDNFSDFGCTTLAIEPGCPGFTQWKHLKHLKRFITSTQFDGWSEMPETVSILVLTLHENTDTSDKIQLNADIKDLTVVKGSATTDTCCEFIKALSVANLRHFTLETGGLTNKLQRRVTDLLSREGFTGQPVFSSIKNRNAERLFDLPVLTKPTVPPMTMQVMETASGYLKPEKRLPDGMYQFAPTKLPANKYTNAKRKGLSGMHKSTLNKRARN